MSWWHRWRARRIESEIRGLMHRIERLEDCARRADRAGHGKALSGFGYRLGKAYARINKLRQAQLRHRSLSYPRGSAL